MTALENQKSNLLSSVENESLYALLGRGCCALAIAIVRVYQANERRNWEQLYCGVACFVRDKTVKAYFIRIYDIYVSYNSFFYDRWIDYFFVQNKKNLLNQELYVEIQYNKPSTRFHVIQSDNGPLGFSFSCEKEAKLFSNLVCQRILRRQQRHNPPKVAVDPSKNPMRSVGSIQSGISEPNRPVAPTYHMIAATKKKDKRKGKKPAITSSDISGPTDFRHIEHVGFNASSNTFETSAKSSIIKAMLSAIGQGDEMNDPGTQEFVRQFVEEQGGWNAAEQVLQTVPAAAPETRPPARRVPPPPPPPPSSHPPPPPVPGMTKPNVPPPPRVMQPPPPPPPLPPMTSGGIPPPPPMLPSMPTLPNPPVLSSPSSTNQPPPPPRGSAAAEPDLQSQIQSFKFGNLRNVKAGEGVTDRPVPPTPTSAGTEGGGGGQGNLLQSLAAALDMRRAHMRQDSDDENNSDSGDGSSDEDWDS